MVSLKNQVIVVTGGTGFLGTYLVKLLKKEGAKVIASSSKDYDLRNSLECKKLFKSTKPDIVVHLAANVGGIGYNQENPASLFYDNLMNINILNFLLYQTELFLYYYFDFDYYQKYLIYFLSLNYF